MKTMVYGAVGNIVIGVHSADPPTETEWDAWVSLLREASRIGGVENVRNLVLTEGGAPNSAQRKKVNDLLNGRAGLCAVVSDSAIVRGVVTAFNWYNPMIKAFSPSQMDSALQYLRISGKQAQDVLALTKKLKADLAALKARGGREA